MKKNITLSEEYDRFWSKIQNNENFALVRSADGEHSIICGRKVIAQEGWQNTEENSKLLAKDIDATFDVVNPNFYFGVSCPDCDMEGYLWYRDRIKNKKNITFSNIWVNTNYKRFAKDFFELKRDAIVIANYRAKGKQIGNLNIKKYYSVTDDCFTFWGEDSEKMINEIISDFGAQNNLLYVVSAGPMAGPIIERLFKNNPNNCYIDFGSSIDGFYREVTTRPYMIPGTMYAERDCWMYNPSEPVIESIIPKTIHYCWFGRGKKPGLVKKCIESWKKCCPDYEIIEWNEDNFDVNQTIWTKQAYDAKKWAFVADYVKLWVLYNYGGIYMDTDVEVLKPLDRFLIHEAFSGFEGLKSVPTGIIGSIKNQTMIKEFLDWYNNRAFIDNGVEWHEPNTKFMTEIVKKNGGLEKRLLNYYQIVNGLALYPQTYFCPKSIDQIYDCKSEYTYAIHHFSSSWRTKAEIKGLKKAKQKQVGQYCKYLIKKTVRFVIGNKRVEYIKSKFNGNVR